MEGLLCIAFVLCVFVVSGKEVLLSDLSEDDADWYEKNLMDGVAAYNGKIMKELYKERLVDQTTVEMGENDGNFTLNFYTHLMKCSLGIQLIEEFNGTETALPDKKYFSLFQPKCGPYVMTSAMSEVTKVKSKVRRVKNKLLDVSEKLQMLKATVG